MKAIPLHRVAVVLPFTRFLADIGAPVERGFRLAGLPFAALDDLNNYVPTRKFWTFVGHMSRIEGIEDLGFRVGLKYGAHCADPHLPDLLSQSPTLYHAIIKTSALVKNTISRSRVGLIPLPNNDQFHFFHQPSFDADNPFIDQMDWFGLMALLGIVRLFAGPQWQPTQVGLTTRHPACNSIQEQLPQTRILTAQPYAYVKLNTQLMSLPSFSHNAKPGMQPYTKVLNDFTGSLKQVLRTYLPENDLTIELAAQLCNTSKRSLQRKLTEAGTRYSEVLDLARFDAASELLQDPDIKVTDVALQLGYSDSAHFSRAFKRVAGVNPRVYRQAYAH
jgi:AraC-like DNA-binding protein